MKIPSQAGSLALAAADGVSDAHLQVLYLDVYSGGLGALVDCGDCVCSQTKAVRTCTVRLRLKPKRPECPWLAGCSIELGLFAP